MNATRRSKLTRPAFDAAYDTFVRPGGFHELDSYYSISRERYFLTLGYLVELNLPEGAKLLDVGGGQFAILSSKLFGYQATVGDIGDDFRTPADSADVSFVVCNLLHDDPAAFRGQFDVVVLAEVIEHLPVPPYVVLSKVRSWLKPGGALLLTTPNLFRLRNIVRMIRGRDPFDTFMLPRDGISLGHQTEYSAEHLAWHIREAGFLLDEIAHDQLGHTGFSWKARAARKLLAPLRLRKIWREELVAVARNPQ
ncbi:class I SAM-dependent methyltransferase [Sphingomonas agri]|uniref:class I SAM-dependent methyltransferase n=1 Tax=Sphingomonas agri TaxID=1813878 RepID=UPI00311DB7F8